MSFGKIKRNIADKHFSDCVRMRSNWHCQRCGKDKSEKKQGLQCSHLIGRGHYGTRYDPECAIALCAHCHTYVTGHPVAHIQLWRDIYGSVYGRDSSDVALNALLQRSACKERAKYARANTKAIADYYREVAKELAKEIEGREGLDETYDFHSCRYREKTLGDT
jgi:hypothetical protein